MFFKFETEVSMKRNVPKTGYLNEDCKIFYLSTLAFSQAIDTHYHDFHKILIFLGGIVRYVVEGKEYLLQPGDIVLVNAGEHHKPMIDSRATYERLIFYLSPTFFDRCHLNDPDAQDLSFCFSYAKKHQTNRIRLSKEGQLSLEPVVHTLISSFQEKGFAAPLLQQIKVIEYLILLSRILMKDNPVTMPESSRNPIVQNIMNLIHDSLTEPLSIDRIAEHCFLDRSYIMHLFKAETGCTIGSYITEKRLFLARHYISEGFSVTDACFKSGFNNYGSFYHAYRKKYHASPKTAVSDILPTHILPE